MLHATGEFSGETLAEFAHARGLQKLPGTLFALGFSHSEQVSVEADIFIDGKVFIKAEALRHVTEVVLSAFRIVNDIHACDSCHPFIGRHDAREHAKGRGFSRTIGTDQAEDFSRADVEA